MFIQIALVLEIHGIVVIIRIMKLDVAYCKRSSTGRK